MSTLAAAALSMMIALQAPDAPHDTFPGWAETPTARLERYNRIAVDVAAVVEETCAKAADDKAVARCQRWALPVLIGIGTHESGWAPDVDSPEGCYRGPGFTSRCDGGASVSYWQLRVGGQEGARLRSDRRAAAHEALRRAMRSWHGCTRMEPALRWSIYAGGSCSNPTAQRRSRELDAFIQQASRAWPVVQ